ncbi:MAG TPA: hypothetical protein VK428_01165 [Acidimicrobiales bacterium]|nr:hypothetical protein [Acidimicrobiales bacterium]
MTDRPVSTLSDDDLLELLAEAWAPAALDPSPVSVTEVRLAFIRATELGTRAHRRRLVPRPLRGRGWSWRARLAVAGAAIGVVVAGAGTAFAAGAPVPSPVRQLAYDIGLPVTPPAVVQVQSDARSVRADLAAGSAAGAGATAQDAGALARALRQLSPAERASVTWSQRVLSRACRLLSAEQTSTSPTSSAAAATCQGFGPSYPAGGGRGTAPQQNGGAGPYGVPGSTGTSGRGAGGPQPGSGAPGGSQPGRGGSGNGGPGASAGSGGQAGSGAPGDGPGGQSDPAGR